MPAGFAFTKYKFTQPKMRVSLAFTMNQSSAVAELSFFSKSLSKLTESVFDVF